MKSDAILLKSVASPIERVATLLKSVASPMKSDASLLERVASPKGSVATLLGSDGAFLAGARAEMIKTAPFWRKRGLPEQKPRRLGQKLRYLCQMRRLPPDKMTDLGRELAWRENQLAESVENFPSSFRRQYLKSRGKKALLFLAKPLHLLPREIPAGNELMTEITAQLNA